MTLERSRMPKNPMRIMPSSLPARSGPRIRDVAEVSEDSGEDGVDGPPETAGQDGDDEPAGRASGGRRACATPGREPLGSEEEQNARDSGFGVRGSGRN